MKWFFGIPAFSGFKGAVTQWDAFVMATEKVRTQVKQPKRAMKARVGFSDCGTKQISKE